MPNAEPNKALSRIENARYVLDQLAELGFPPKPGSRLMRMHRVWQRGPHEFGTPEFWTALESDRDMVQLGFVFEQLGVDRDNAAFIEVVKRLLSDSVLPQHDRKQSPGRDAQFELCLAAMCNKAGLVPVGFAEPDVTCAVNGVPFSIAAKRIKSVQQVRKRIKDAANQIASQQRRGIIALDMSIGFNQANAPVVSPLHNQMLDAINEMQAAQFFDEHEGFIKKHCLGRGVVGVVVYNLRARIKHDQWCQDRFTMWTEVYTNEDDHRIYQEFYDRFSVVNPSRQQTIEGK